MISSTKKIVSLVNKPLLPFPLKFSINYPLIFPPLALSGNFFDATFDIDVEYYFSFDNLDDYRIMFTATDPNVLQHLQYEGKRNITLTQCLAFYLVCINTFYYSKKHVLEMLNSLSLLPENVIPEIYILNYLMAVELLLPAKRITNLEEINLSQGKEIVCNCRRKVWNLLIFWHIYPKTIDEHLKIYAVIRSNFIYRLQDYNFRASLGPKEKDYLFFLDNLAIKGPRLLNDYCSHLENIIPFLHFVLANYTRYFPLSYTFKAETIAHLTKTNNV